MANTFKVKTKTEAPSSAGTFVDLYTVPGATTTVVLGLVLCNLDTSQRTVSVKLDPDGGDTVLLLKNVPIPAGSSLEVLSGGKIALETGDLIQIDCDVAAKIDATLSIMEIT
tara:strand:- start:60 stop:395 length:336 start_codon:yes stop_codon:yes gene_type:complete